MCTPAATLIGQDAGIIKKHMPYAKNVPALVFVKRPTANATGVLKLRAFAVDDVDN